MSSSLDSIRELSTRHFQAARSALRDYLAAHPADAEGWRLAARWAETPEQAAQCYEKALALCPDDLSAKQGLVAARYPGHTFDPAQGIVPAEPFALPARSRPAWRVAQWAGAGLLALAVAGLGLTWAQTQPPAAPALFPPDPAARVSAPAADVAPPVSAVPLEKQALLEALIGLARLAIESDAGNAPTAPGPAQAVDVEQGRAFRRILKQALPEPGSAGQTLITEAQLTGWLALELANMPELPVRDPQVFLLDERVHVFATLTDGSRSTTALVVGGARLDEAGGLTLFIDSAQFGGLSVPQPLIDQGVAWLNARLAQEMDQQAPGLKITSLNWLLRAVQVTGQR